MESWAWDAIFYHIYPLGAFGAPSRNDRRASPTPRMVALFEHLDRLQALGVGAIYLGPVFESSTHGYDTCDYFHVDRRLGDNALLQRVAESIHQRGMRLILDGVFNHVGREFWAFESVRKEREASPFCGWFADLSFMGTSAYGDPFTYADWNGFQELVKLNLEHPEVRSHLLHAVSTWLEDYEIDGLRLDAADAVSRDFLQVLARHCREQKADIYLFGEVVHGDYRLWANDQLLQGATNYEAYKGLYSSHNDRNLFEIAYALKRQYGTYGLYREIPLYNFVDNHDVDRLASVLHRPQDLYTVYLLLFTMPGVPSIYYASEWGTAGKKGGDDSALRPPFPSPPWPHPDLEPAITRFIGLRRELAALRRGHYKELAVASEQLAFARHHDGQTVVIAINSAAEPCHLKLPLRGMPGGQYIDKLNSGEMFRGCDGRLEVLVDPHWGRVLVAV